MSNSDKKWVLVREDTKKKIPGFGPYDTQGEADSHALDAVKKIEESSGNKRMAPTVKAKQILNG